MALYDAGDMRTRDGLLRPTVPSRYAENGRARWPALAVIAGLHMMLIATLDIAGVLPVRRGPSELKLIQLSPEMAPPPPVARAELPETVEPRPIEQARPAPSPVRIAAPAPIVSTPVAAPMVAPLSPPPAPALAPVQSGPVRVADLDTRAVTIVAPKYPVESRRKREQGIVVLSVTLDIDGRVAELELAKSSGFERLDRAALDAVRRWRWSPTLSDGAAVAVRGTVEIPFILQG